MYLIFKEIIELRFVVVYRWGFEKVNIRVKCDVKWIEDIFVELVFMIWNVKNFNFWK